MNKVAVSEDEPDEGNGPIVTIRDNMIAIAIIVVLAASGMFMTAHYQPWQLSSTTRSAHPTNVQTTIGCCAGTSQTARPQLTPSSAIPAGFGVVVGQITPWYGDTRNLPTQPPAHPAGTVVVLRGTDSWVPGPAGGVSLQLPTETVTAESIPAGGQYRFILAPGSYVIETTEPLWDYTRVSVVAGQTINTKDVPHDPYR
jgi:hypothetical protein